MIHVIILCQGNQSRLPDLKIPKQKLPLDRGGVTMPLINRTIGLCDVAIPMPMWVTIVGRRSDFSFAETGVEVVELTDPGNSSLKGLHRYLEHRRTCGPRADAGGTVVLLGDVVYSRDCVKLLGTVATTDFAFYTSPDLSPSGGEVWAVVWPRDREKTIDTVLDLALAKHPPFEAYQPGQMRRLLYAARGSSQVPNPVVITSLETHFIRDFDKPDDLQHFEATARRALIDDREHGITW